LFDISGSTAVPEIRQRYYEDFQQVVTALRGGELLLGDIITENTMARLSFPIREQFPTYNPFVENRVQHEQEMRKAIQECRKKARGLTLKALPAPRTDLLNAFQAADRRVFNGPMCRHFPRKTLIVFSDMIEQSTRYNFATAELTPRRIQEIIEKERRERGLPNLKGIEVWIVGATAAVKGGMTEQRIYEIESFWRTYLRACGADLKSYGPRLLGFALPAERKG